MRINCETRIQEGRHSKVAWEKSPVRNIDVVVLATHPIQYHIPWFRALSETEGLAVTVLFSMLPDEQQQGVGFGVNFSWDIPMLDGYQWTKLLNTARKQSLASFFGVNTPRVFELLANRRPDIVVLTGWQGYSLIQGYWAALRLRIPVVMRAESNALRARPWWKRIIHRLLLSQIDAALAIGKTNRDFYVGNGVATTRIFDAPYFVDNTRIRADYDRVIVARERLRSDWAIPADSTCFVFVGKLQEKKRVLDLIEAFRLAHQSNSDLHLLIVGTGELMSQAQQLASASHLPATFAGFLNQSRIVEAYAAGDCLVLPSDFGETWGLVVNEAMVCGLPAIVSDRVGCGPDLVEEDITGAVFRFGDTKHLAEKMIHVGTDAARRATMGAHARARVANYSIERAVQGTVAAIRAVSREN